MDESEVAILPPPHYTAANKKELEQELVQHLAALQQLPYWTT